MRYGFHMRWGAALLTAALAASLSTAAGQAVEDPLLAAAEAGNLAEVKALLDGGRDLHVRGVNGNTALHLAAMGGHAELISYLVSRKAGVDARNDFGETPLHRVDGRSAAGALVDAGAMLEARDTEFDMTPLFNADLEVSAFLIEKGAEVDASGPQGMTPLIWACQSGFLEKVELLIENGADVNAGGGKIKTALHAASNWGHVEIMRRLLVRDARIEARDGSGWTPLHWAAFEGGPEAAALLIDRGADKNARTLDGWSMFAAGSTPLDIAERARFGMMVEFLRARGCKRGRDIRGPSRTR